jgi:hypothetical protein
VVRQNPIGITFHADGGGDGQTFCSPSRRAVYSRLPSPPTATRFWRTTGIAVSSLTADGVLARHSRGNPQQSSRAALLRALLRDPRDRLGWREAGDVRGEVLEVIFVQGDHERNAVDHGRRDDVGVVDPLAHGRGLRKESE